jgi:uncharacterized membrane protein
MAAADDAPVDLYIAAYPDPDAARGDWDTIKQLANDDLIKVDGLILVSRRGDGKIHVDDDFHETRKGAAWGAVGGAVVGLIFPPALLASAAVGAGVGAGIGGLISHGQKAEIKADVEDTLPLNSSGVVAVFEPQWAEAIDNALSNASKVTKEQVDRDSADQVKAAASENPPPPTTG